MNWFFLTLASAAALGVYDIAKKHAVRDNAALPVLFWSTATGSACFVIAIALCGRIPEFNREWYWWIWGKSLLVAASWSCVYYALRDLPISIAAPIRSSAPLWTFIGAVFWFDEIPTWPQGLAMLLIFGGYFYFNLIGQKEGFSFFRSRSMNFMIAGTLLGAAAALFDKYLLTRIGIDRVAMQFHFAIDLALIFGAALALRRLFRSGAGDFQWRWTIPLVGVLLIAADFLYFYAVGEPGAPISQVSLLRRSNCVITFAFGAWIFHDRNIKRKALALALILAGVILIGLAE